MPKRKRRFWKRVKQTLLFLLLLPYTLTLLYFFVPPPSTLMLARWLTFQRVERDWVPLTQISPHLQAAVIASEDGAFCDHFGFDFDQMEKSIEAAYEDDRPLRGASTITMQTAKNLYLWSGRSWIRKILEVPLTLWLEVTWSKRRILEAYLNVAEWGDGIYGAEAASRHHFGVSAAALSPHQAALLAASLPNPLQRSAGHPSANHLLHAAAIQHRAATRSPSLSCLR